MTTLNTKNFTTLVQEWAAVCQSSVASVFPTVVLSFTKGAVLRALAEAQASVSLWLQGIILQLLTVTRLATSQGVDVDSYVNDYGLTRLPANASTGLVTFARVTPTNPGIIPIGATVQSSDGSQTFAVYADTTNSSYTTNADGKGNAGYVIPSQVLTLQVPVQNLVAGSAGNIQAGVITIIQTGMSGIDTVTNVAAFTNGFDSESDAALRKRFVAFINSLSKGTEGAITFGIQSVQQGMQVQILENPPSVPNPPSVTVWVDDGSGAIPAATLAAAQATVILYRAAGVNVAVFAATKLLANVTMTIVTAPGYYHPTVVAQVVAALGSYINGIGLQDNPTDSALSYGRLFQIAFDASPGVTDVLGCFLQGSQLDLVPANGQTIKSGTIVVS